MAHEQTLESNQTYLIIVLIISTIHCGKQLIKLKPPETVVRKNRMMTHPLHHHQVFIQECKH